MKLKPGMQVTMMPLGKCACGQDISASTNFEPVPAVAHALPYCKEFEQMDPVDFLTYVRRSRGIPDPPPEGHAA